MSSRYTGQNRSMYRRRISFIKRCHVAGALVSPNSITSDSKSPSFVQNAVRYSRPFLIQMLTNAATISTFKKYLIPFRLFRVSFVSRKGYLSFLDTLLRH